jgi:hypothetical protein
MSINVALLVILILVARITRDTSALVAAVAIMAYPDYGQIFFLAELLWLPVGGLIHEK